jgi:hypothetical protein
MSANKNDYVSDRRLYLDKDGNVVEHNDVNKLTLLVAEGGSLSQEDARKYGLIDAEGNRVEAAADKNANIESKKEADSEMESDSPDPSTLRGKLADSFPAKAKLEAADLTTYAQVRNAIKKDPEGWYGEIEGIGGATAVKIAEAVGASQEGDEEE